MSNARVRHRRRWRNRRAASHRESALIVADHKSTLSVYSKLPARDRQMILKTNPDFEKWVRALAKATLAFDHLAQSAKETSLRIKDLRVYINYDLQKANNL